MTSQVSLLGLIGQYPILAALSSYLSTIDLLHLGLTTRRSYALILGSPEVFDVLKRQCLCDGRGLRQRLADSFSGTKRHVPGYEPAAGSAGDLPWDIAEHTRFLELVNKRLGDDDQFVPRWCRWEEAEIEVRLYARRCDAAGALPCRRCGVNICEECRDYPRVLPDLCQWPNRRPHLRADGWHENVVCLCPPCDAALERRLQGRFLSPLCDCDRYRRWVCRKCVDAEAREAAYRRDCTRATWSSGVEVMEGIQLSTKQLPGGLDGMLGLAFYCPCGADVPDDTRFRCAWCKRRHRPESEWPAELAEAKATVPPHVDDGGCYPMYSPRRYAHDTYPRLAYEGPIHRHANKASEAEGRDGEEAGTTLSVSPLG